MCGTRELRWGGKFTQTAIAAQPKSPRRIQADGGGSGVYAAVLVRRTQQTFDANASVALSAASPETIWPTAFVAAAYILGQAIVDTWGN